MLRQAGITLVEQVHRSGTIAPWLYIPPVVALATDTQPAVADKSIAILKYCASKPVRIANRPSCAELVCSCMSGVSSPARATAVPLARAFDAGASRVALVLLAHVSVHLLGLVCRCVPRAPALQVCCTLWRACAATQTRCGASTCRTFWLVSTPAELHRYQWQRILCSQSWTCSQARLGTASRPRYTCTGASLPAASGCTSREGAAAPTATGPPSMRALPLASSEP